jgi:hypothetical protein
MRRPFSDAGADEKPGILLCGLKTHFLVMGHKWLYFSVVQSHQIDTNDLPVCDNAWMCVDAAFNTGQI